MDEIRILGIDPGLNLTGYGVIAARGTDSLRVVEAGVLRGGDARKEIGSRLLALRQGLCEVIDLCRPDCAAVEELYSHYERPKTAILMGHARGAMILTMAERGLPVFHYPATRIKRMATGNGRAGKAQMQQAISRFLELPEVPEPPDVADALAVAVCHYYLQVRPTGLAGPHRATRSPSSSEQD